MNTYEHSIAAYPIEFKQIVVSPQKLCLQFKTVQCKTRAPHNKNGLKKTHHGTWEMPIDTHGTNIEVLAVGIPLKMYPQLLREIMSSIDKHDELYPEHAIKQEILNGLKSTNS